jgi:pimeloyl-ACP methyl ester carboxylesterase
MDALDLPHTDKGPRSASPVILLHGFPVDHTMWAPQAAALEAAGHRVLVPDLRGMGKAPVTKAT